jgi:hypothetical protein
MLIQQENDGGVSSTMIFIRTFVNVTMYPQYSNNITKKKKKKYSHLSESTERRLFPGRALDATEAQYLFITYILPDALFSGLLIVATIN